MATDTATAHSAVWGTDGPADDWTPLRQGMGAGELCQACGNAMPDGLAPGHSRECEGCRKARRRRLRYTGR